MDNRAEDVKDAEAPAGGFFANLSTYAAGALRYWEPRRLIYNAVLASVVAAHYFTSGLYARSNGSVDPSPDFNGPAPQPPIGSVTIS